MEKADKEYFEALYAASLQALATSQANQEALAFILNSLDKKADGEHYAILRQRTADLVLEAQNVISQILKRNQ